MYNEGLSYNEALEKARKEGYAENDVSEDVGGWDALYKMCILLQFGAGMDVNPKHMTPHGIELLTNLSYDKSKGKVKQPLR